MKRRFNVYRGDKVVLEGEISIEEKLPLVDALSKQWMQELRKLRSQTISIDIPPVPKKEDDDSTSTL